MLCPIEELSQDMCDFRFELRLRRKSKFQLSWNQIILSDEEICVLEDLVRMRDNIHAVLEKYGNSIFVPYFRPKFSCLGKGSIVSVKLLNDLKGNKNSDEAILFREWLLNETPLQLRASKSLRDLPFQKKCTNFGFSRLLVGSISGKKNCSLSDAILASEKCFTDFRRNRLIVWASYIFLRYKDRKGRKCITLPTKVERCPMENGAEPETILSFIESLYKLREEYVKENLIEQVRSYDRSGGKCIRFEKFKEELEEKLNRDGVDFNLIKSQTFLYDTLMWTIVSKRRHLPIAQFKYVTYTPTSGKAYDESSRQFEKSLQDADDLTNGGIQKLEDKKRKRKISESDKNLYCLYVAREKVGSKKRRVFGIIPDSVLEEPKEEKKDKIDYGQNFLQYLRDQGLGDWIRSNKK